MVTNTATKTFPVWYNRKKSCMDGLRNLESSAENKKKKSFSDLSH